MLQTYEQAEKKLKALGQEHLLRYYAELSEDGKAQLLSQIGELDEVYLDAFSKKDSLSLPEQKEITPIDVMCAAEIESRREEFLARGISAAKEGKIAAVLLAGGMGTRLGADGPKGTVDIGVTRHVYIFQRIFENLSESADAAGRSLHLFIMTSESNHDETVSFLKEHRYFGYDPEYVHFYRQEMAPAVDRSGRIILESRGRIASSPNGNGGWFRSLLKAGYGSLIEDQGIEWLNVFSVDNVLQRICDPVFFGAVLESGLPSGSKVVAKSSPEERVGVMCNKGGRPAVVEYYELTDSMRYEKRPDGSYAYYYGVILNYLFRIRDLEEADGKGMPIHFADKSIAAWDPVSGQTVKSKEPNGWKFEYFIFDILNSLDGCLPFEVIRDREFAPVKNASGPDSPETARELLRKNGIEI